MILKAILLLCFMVSASVSSARARGVDISGGADFVAELSCYFESPQGIWTSVDIKYAMSQDFKEGYFRENALIQTGHLGKPQAVTSNLANLSMTPGAQEIMYSGFRDMRLAVHRSPLKSQHPLMSLPREIFELYQVHAAKLAVKNQLHEGYCVHYVEFFLAKTVSKSIGSTPRGPWLPRP